MFGWTADRSASCQEDTSKGEVEMSTLAEVIKGAMSLGTRDRATLAEKLLASLEELSEEEAEGLWAEEAQRRFRRTPFMRR